MLCSECSLMNGQICTAVLIGLPFMTTSNRKERYISFSEIIKHTYEDVFSKAYWSNVTIRFQ